MTGPFLLRLLLSATLILNGSVWALPGGHADMGAMAASGTPEPSHAATDSAASQPPCHESAADGAASLSLASVDDPGAIFDTDPTDDCCGSSVCACDCLHHGGFVGEAPFPRLRATHEPQAVVAREREHLAPMLPDLNRPPIG